MVITSLNSWQIRALVKTKQVSQTQNLSIGCFPIVRVKENNFTRLILSREIIYLHNHYLFRECPVCNKDVKQGDIIADEAAKKKVLALEIRCPSKHTCRWRGELEKFIKARL